MTIETGLVPDDAGLQALAAEWEALWTRVPGATPFQHPAWLLSWWRQFGTGQPRIAWARRDGRLAGLLPLYLLDEPPARKLLPIGAGLTDYQDALLEPGMPVAPLLAAALRQAGIDRVTTCDLICLPPGAALRDAAAPPGWDAVLHPTETAPVLDLRAEVPARQRRKWRMNQHRADRLGGFTVEAATPETLDALWAALARLHQARWTGAGEPGVLADPRVGAFLHGALPGLLAAGLLRLCAVWVQDQVAAVCLALLSGDRALFYMSGYDAAFATCSPGTLLLGAMLEQACAEGRRELHFLRGNESYKYAWGAVDQSLATLQLRPAQDRCRIASGLPASG